MPPVQPMLAKAVTGVPDPAKSRRQGLSFEPKWDGFRCLLFKDGDEVELASRNTKPLTRYFPELVTAARDQLPDRCVLDGEIFVALTTRRRGTGCSSRCCRSGSTRRRAGSTCWPSRRRPSFVAFDLLALGDESYVDRPFAERRAALERRSPTCRRTGRATSPAPAPTRRSPRSGSTQFEGAGLDGVVAKPMGAPYQQNARTMLKIKHERTADVVVAGMREHKTSTPERPLLGSLLLGLYDDGELQHVGVSASFTEARRAELWQEMQALVVPIEEHPWGKWQEFLVANPGRQPGTQSRWSAGKDLSFTPLRPERVLEVKYDAMEGRRFRHTAHFKRWREDRDPESCGYDQLEQPVSYDLADVLGGGAG